jgi:hypothetical protein
MKLMRDAVYTFSSKESLDKFVSEYVGFMTVVADSDCWFGGGRWNIHSKTIREIKKIMTSGDEI